MSDENILDIAHLSFLDMIKIMITMSGAASVRLPLSWLAGTNT
jgi:hypothetical protein